MDSLNGLNTKLADFSQEVKNSLIQQEKSHGQSKNLSNDQFQQLQKEVKHLKETHD